MKASRIITLITFGSFLFSCVREPVTESEKTDVVRLRGVMEYDADTKTVLRGPVDDLYYPVWENADSIAVFTEAGQSPAVFRLIAGEGSTMADFVGSRIGEEYIAFYPFSKDYTFDGERIQVTMPNEQNYKFSSYSSDGYPMVAIGNGNELRFKNLCSIIHLQLSGSAYINKIVLSSDEINLSGAAEVNIADKDNPVLQLGNDGCHDVSLLCYGLPLQKNVFTDFYIVVPPGTYSGLNLSIETITETVTKTVTKPIELKRSEIRSVTPMVLDAQPIDLDNVPSNQIWYKTNTGTILEFSVDNKNRFDVNIINHQYIGDYGVIILDGPLKEINDYALLAKGGKQWVTELHLPNSVERIASLSLPSTLNQIRLPDNLKEIGLGNINYCSRVYGRVVDADERSVVIDNELVAVASKDLSCYITPLSATGLRYSCLWNCQFEEIIVSEGVRTIGHNAFSSCSNLKRLYLPNSLLSIGVGLCVNCPNIESFYGNPLFVSQDNLCLLNPYSYWGKELVSIVAGREEEEYHIQDDICNISATFINWPNLKTIYLPESLEFVQPWAFVQNCPNFEGYTGTCASEDGKSIVLHGYLEHFYCNEVVDYTVPEGVVAIGQWAFTCWANGNDYLETVTVSEGVKALVNGAFYKCHKLKTVYLPTTITHIGNTVFGDCENLESVFLPVSEPPTLTEFVPIQMPGMSFYVPEEALDKYLNSEQWWPYYNNLKGYKFEQVGPHEPYKSTDYSLDGKVTVLQEATEGYGIDIILMGDAFSDRLVQDGTYLSWMEKAYEAFFDEQPYASLRYLFNVYVVNVVSESEDFRDFYHTALQLKVDETNQRIILDTDTQNAIHKYALKAIPDSRLEEATIIAFTNTYSSLNLPAGTCYYFLPDYYTGDYGQGHTLALLTSTQLKALVHHEAGGHGFAKLGDEYSDRGVDGNPLSASEYEEYVGNYFPRGYYRNIDVTQDATDIKWARFLSDGRYSGENIGIFEGGGGYYTYGVYRPSYESIMRSNFGGYNAPSREAIYYRINKLAYGDSWEYDYEQFVRFDLSHRYSYNRPRHDIYRSMSYEIRDPLPAPEQYHGNWMVVEAK